MTLNLASSPGIFAKMATENSIQETKQTKDSSMRTTLATFLNLPSSEIKLDSFSKYQEYYERTWTSLRSGDPPEADSMDPINEHHIQVIVDMISREITLGRPCHRAALRTTLEKTPEFHLHSQDSIDRTIDLSLRLWLILNIRDDDFAPGTHSIQWNETQSLQTFIADQFPRPRLLKELSDKIFDFVLPDNFTMVKLKRYSGIKVDWTFDLSQHLELDSDHRILKIFPLKHYLKELKKRFEVKIKLLARKDYSSLGS